MSTLTIQQAFELALQHHQAGQLSQAQQIYRQLLVQQPDHPDALHLLGVIAFQMGDHDTSIELIRRALAIKSDWPEALCNLGNALAATGRLDDAIAAHRRAIALNPNLPEAYSNLGNALREAGRLDESIAACRQAIALDPKLSQAHGNLGAALTEKGDLYEAIASLRRAIDLNPRSPENHNNLGKALREKGLPDEAIAAWRQAITLRPDLPEPHNNLGNALADIGQLDAAIVALRRAIALNPNLPEAHNNLGNALLRQGELDAAIAACRQAIALKPNYADAHNNLGLALLSRGEFAEGWQEHDWRWRSTGFAKLQRNFAVPQWDGSPLNARTILIHAEQGLGDTLQFVRYVPMVAARGGRILLECQPDLLRLLRANLPDCVVAARGDALHVFEIHSPLLSLPRIFRTTFDTIPSACSYLQADAHAANAWRQRLESHSTSLKVGLAWAGSAHHKNDRNRSISVAMMSSLARVNGVSFVSLQKRDAHAQSNPPPAGLDLIDWTAELNDFADTAALIANLDLIISVDTAVAHLAGAMGKPVWTLLPFAPDWRWLMDRVDSPWYPTMRLFRQPTKGDWDSVISEVVEALSMWINNRV